MNKFCSQALQAVKLLLPKFSVDPTDSEIYPGLLTVIIRLIFLNHCEASKLLPIEYCLLSEMKSELNGRSLISQPETFSCYNNLVSLFAKIYSEKGGDLFDPSAFPFLLKTSSNLVDDHTIYKVLSLLSTVEGETLDYRSFRVEQIGQVYEELMGYEVILGANGSLEIAPSGGRRKTGCHYTPPELAKSVVERALEPLMATMGPAPKSESLLNLVVCDPAMGSGAFLVAACEYLAAQLVAAWSREGQQQLIGNAAEDVTVYAKRLVTQRCLLGVDKNRYAVQLARISLWLTTMSRHEPFTFVDHALRHGDSLVGLSLEQIKAFHWKPPTQTDLLEVDLRGMVDEALEERRGLLDLARRSGVRTSAKQRLLFQARDALADLQLVGDVLLGAFFAAEKDRDRDDERKRRRDTVQQWLLAEQGDAKEKLRLQLETWQCELRRTQVPFHWMLEYTDVFCDARPDPLDGDRSNGAACVDAIVGNPPFMGGSSVSGGLGGAYKDWLPLLHPGAHGNADICAHFFRRAETLLGNNGSLALIATNTLAQGDTRHTGLQHLLSMGFRIEQAITNMPWPGDAAVTVSICQMSIGTPSVASTRRILNGRDVHAINSRLLAGQELPDPEKLLENAGMSFAGAKIYGQGFILDPDQREHLIRIQPTNAKRIFPYLSGDEINTSPKQAHHRYVIDFGTLSLVEASSWPELLDIVRREVKPERDRLRDNADGRRRKQFWWQFGRGTPALCAAVARLKRCIVTAQVTKHLCFSFQLVDRVFSQKTYVFPFESYTHIGILQSRLHDSWTRLLSSTLGETLSYAPSDCFETFPFPDSSPNTLFPAINSIGEKLYQARTKFMVDTDQGLTKTYNALKDPSNQDVRIVILRDLHEQLDRAVLDAYGWKDIEVPPYCPRNPAEEAQLQAFKDEVIDRLFALNAERAEREATEAAAAPVPAGKRKAKRARKL